MKEIETAVPLGRRRRQEFVFREFFELGQEESASPFLTPFARRLSRNLPLKASIFSAFLLLGAYLTASSFFPLSAILLASVYLIVGIPSLINSIEDIVVQKDVNIDVLMTLAAFSAVFMGSGLEGALLLVLFSLSGAIEEMVSFKAKSALLTLHRLVPIKACVVEDGQIIERAIQDVSLNSIVLVRAGEIIPLDGVVVEGSSLINLVHLTGESIPVKKVVGDQVPSGATVVDSSLTIRVTHTSSNSTVAQIVELITQAQNAKPRLESWFDRFGRRYALTIISISFFCALSFAPLLGIPYLGTEGSIYRALAFLITASPCALILAVPIAYLSALGACAKKGIVLKGGIVLDALEECSVIAFDKTGTLTLGELSVESMYRSSNDETFSDDDLFAVAGTLERHAVHPIAKAIVEKASALELWPVKEITVIPGSGVEGVVTNNGRDFRAFIGDLNRAKSLLGTKEAKNLEIEAEKLKKQGKLVAACVIDDKGFLISLTDMARPNMRQMLDALRQSGRRVMMLTGDHRESAERIAKEVGINEFEADLKPEDKLSRIEAIAKSEGLAMCGDGINDAPALARATVGISMGQVGSATAQAVSDVIFLRDNIECLDWLFLKAKKTRGIVVQNLLIASLAIIGGTIPSLYGVLPLWLAVIVHEGGTVLVGLNAIRLLRK